jgi:hypothetical protein
MDGAAGDLHHIRPWRRIERRRSRKIRVGSVEIGGDAPIAVQSMTNTLTSDAVATINQIRHLEEAGADIVRLNMAHAKHDWTRTVIRRIRAVSARLGRDVYYLDQRGAGLSSRLNLIRDQPYSVAMHVADLEAARVAIGADRVVLAGGGSAALPPGVQDTSSQFVQMTWLFNVQPQRLRVGETLDMPLALPQRVSLWRYDVVGEERLVLPFGPVSAWYLKPRPDSPGKTDLSVEVWIAPSLQYLPVRLRIRQDAEAVVDLTLSRLPQQAAPASTAAPPAPSGGAP